MITAVIPVYNEEESLEKLHEQIDEVGKTNDYDLEIVFVDDGSKDRSCGLICVTSAD